MSNRRFHAIDQIVRVEIGQRSLVYAKVFAEDNQGDPAPWNPEVEAERIADALNRAPAEDEAKEARGRFYAKEKDGEFLVYRSGLVYDKAISNCPDMNIARVIADALNILARLGENPEETS